ncbi:MAG: transposase [Dehalococcoidia bacterium]
MDMVVFEENKPYVLEALRNGDFDYIEAAGEVFEAEFFRFIGARRILEKLTETYPTPRKKEDVPLWVYIASNLSMRLHGEHSFNAFPMVVRCGGMLNALGPKVGRKVVHPDSGDVTIACEGFNKKNHYDRQSPCDQDYLRKLSKDTDAYALMRWFCHDVVQVFGSQRVFDKEGIFIGDGSYLFVPDNPNYEGSVKLLFDEHNHPVSEKAYAAMTQEQKARCQWRRCYKMVTLLHTNRTMEYFVFVGLRVVSGKDHECPLLYDLVGQFVESVGTGVMKRLILDRAFLDGEAISICKKDYGIDILIPVRSNMDIYEDAMALFGQPDVNWVCCHEAFEEPREAVRPRPKAVERREKRRQKTLEQIKASKPPEPPEKTLVGREAAAIGEFTSWSSCTVPLSVVANRERYQDGHEDMWLLLDTKEVDDPAKARQEYHIRTAIEERYRQLKCFVDLSDFTSRAFSMVVNQVVFVMLTYNLLQFYFMQQGRQELNSKPMPIIRRRLLPSDSPTIVYWQNYYARFAPYELIDFLLRLGEKVRIKIADKCRRHRLELNDALKNPRPP